MEEKNILIKISTGTIIKFLFIVLFFVLLTRLTDLILIVLLSIVIASAVDPAAVWFQKKGVPRTVAVVLVYLTAFAFLGLLFYIIVPTLFDEFSSFVNNFINYLAEPVSQESFLENILSELPVSVSKILRSFSVKISSYISNFRGGFLNTITALLGGAFSFVLIIVLSFYLSVQEKGIENLLRMITPLRYENYIVDLWLRVRKKIGFWMQGQILLAAIIGILIFLGLTILGINYALTFSLLAAALEIIPVFGPILSSIPPILVGLSISPFMALKVAILYFIVQQFENHLIYPLVVRKIVGIPPVMTILALAAGWQLGGFIGLLLSIPLTAAIIEILDDFDKRKRKIE